MSKEIKVKFLSTIDIPVITTAFKTVGWNNKTPALFGQYLDELERVIQLMIIFCYG